MSPRPLFSVNDDDPRRLSMTNASRTILLYYGGAVVVTALAVLLRWLLDPLLGDHFPFLTLFAAVAFIAWYAGRGPAMFSLVAGAVAAAYLFLQPRYSFPLGQIEYQVGLVLYGVVGFVSIALFESLRKARRHAEQRQRRLEKELAARRAAEQVLADQEELLRITLASLGDAVITTDAGGNVTFLNAVAQELTGWTEVKAIGRPLAAVFRIIHEVSRQPVENPVKGLREGRGVGLTNHTVLVGKDSTERSIDASAAPIRDEGGRVRGVVLVFRDVTERRRAEGKVAESEQKFRATFDQAAVGIAHVAPDGRWLRVNQKLCDIVGYSHGELMGLTFQDITYPDDLEADLGYVRRLLAGEITTYSMEKRYFRKDQSLVWINLTVALARTPQGEPDYFISVVEDISQKKQAEEQFRTLADSIPQLCWMANPDGSIFWFNRRCYEYTGRTMEEMKGWAWESLADPDELPKVVEQWKKSIATGQPLDIVFPLQGKDGVFRPFLTRVQPVKDNAGRVVRWFGTNTDISEAKQAEDELRRAEAALKEADRRKDEFLATLAHELRNPLAPMRNALQILRLSQDREDREEAQSLMQRQLDQMVRLVDDLLDVSRISTGKLELRKEPLRFSAVVNSAVETSRPLIDHMGHELTVSLPEQPITIEADMTRLAQVFSNLLNNSAKYTERGGHIWLTAEQQESDVLVSVKDTGIGIAADQLPRVFHMFSQAEHSLEKAQGGLGIGLSLVKRLVELHGGRIEASSAGLGKGSEFVVRLPMVLKPSGPMAPIEEQPAPPPLSLRILIVDDKRENADSLTKLLRIMGNETLTAYDGQAGVDMAAEFQPDVALLDIGLPKLNGYEACRRIRELAWGREIVLIAVTGWGQEEDRRRSKEAGFDHHMVKPVDPQALMQLLAVIKGSAAATSGMSHFSTTKADPTGVSTSGVGDALGK
jgi:PAS domain S-box-containing protein